MEIIEMARTLGVEIQKDERYQAYAKAKAANDADEELQAAIGEFNLARMALDQEIGKQEGRDEKKIADLNEDLRKAYGKVMRNASMTAYNEAKTALDELISEIETIISAAISGEDPMTCDLHPACTHDCSTCGGCH